MTLIRKVGVNMNPRIILGIIILFILFSNPVSAVSVQLTTSSYGRQPLNIVTEHSDKYVGIWIDFEKNVTNFSYEIIDNELSISDKDYDNPFTVNGVDLSVELSELDDLPFGQYTIPIKIGYNFDNKTYNETYDLNFSYIKDFEVKILKKVKSIGDDEKEIQVMVESFIDLKNFTIELDSDGELVTKPLIHEIEYLNPGKHIFNYSINADDETLLTKQNTYFEIKIRCELKDRRDLYYLSEQYTLNLEENNPLSIDFWKMNIIYIFLIVLLIILVLLLIFHYRKEKKKKE